MSGQPSFVSGQPIGRLMLLIWIKSSFTCSTFFSKSVFSGALFCQACDHFNDHRAQEAQEKIDKYQTDGRV
jgi:hypothetical protein